MIGDAEHLCIFLLVICVSFLEKCLFKPFAHIVIALLFFNNWVLGVLSMFCILLFYQIYDFQIFFYSLGYLFLLCWYLFMHTLFSFSWNSVCLLLFCFLCLWCHIQEIIAKSSGVKLLPYVFLGLTFSSLIHFLVSFCVWY